MATVLKPVVVDGKNQLYDIFVDNVWIGSRRTVKQCQEELRSLSKGECDPRAASVPSPAEAVKDVAG